MFRFADPLWLILLVIPLAVVYHYFRKRGKSDSSVLFPAVQVVRAVGGSRGKIKRILSLLITAAAVVFLLIAMARPQIGQTLNTRSARGIDIILTLDISTSMAAMDFDPLSRYDAATEVVKDFISHRVSDRIGLVVFAAQSFMLCPLTLDYGILRDLLGTAWEARIDDGTAIGSAIATAVNRLRNSDAKSKIIILLTDGMNNSGNIDPLTAARIAATMGVKIYTIGVGTEGQSWMKMNGTMLPVETHIDEASLKQVAQMTGGKYFRAKNKNELHGIYEEIGKLETTKITYREWVQYDEKYSVFLNAGIFLLMLSFILDRTVFRRIP